MVNNVVLAWAIPFTPATLGAQVEAYAHTKNRMSIFRWCVEHAVSGTPLGQLPVEVIDMVAECLLQVTIPKRLARWNQDLKCFHGVCRPSQHITSEEDLTLRKDYINDYINVIVGNSPLGSPLDFSVRFDEERFEEYLKGIGISEVGHERTNQRIEEKIDHDDDEFEQAREVCAASNRATRTESRECRYSSTTSVWRFIS